MTNEARRQRVSALIGTCIVPALLERAGMPTPDGLDALYRSETFALLSDPATGMWHLSAPTLAGMFLRELETGSLETPEEQS